MHLTLHTLLSFLALISVGILPTSCVKKKSRPSDTSALTLHEGAPAHPGCTAGEALSFRLAATGTLPRLTDLQLSGWPRSLTEPKSTRDDNYSIRLDLCIIEEATRSASLAQVVMQNGWGRGVAFQLAEHLTYVAGGFEKKVVFHGQESGKPCLETRDGSGMGLAAGCIQILNTSYTPSTINRFKAGAYSKLSFGSIHIRDNSNNGFYDGKITVTMDSWQGAITYSALDTSPTWTLADGQTTETGTF